jgi:hypothetical protein
MSDQKFVYRNTCAHAHTKEKYSTPHDKTPVHIFLIGILNYVFAIPTIIQQNKYCIFIYYHSFNYHVFYLPFATSLNLFIISFLLHFAFWLFHNSFQSIYIYLFTYLFICVLFSSTVSSSNYTALILPVTG